MPLEFRLGMREQRAEVDALVLNLSGSLTNAQLDALFAVLPGDYNDDGVVNAADYVTWRNTLGQTVAAGSGADGDGDGMIDQDDYTLWRTKFGSSLGSGAAATNAVPEPTALVSLVISLAIIMQNRRRRICS
jgi:hypothetical protein